MLDRYIEETGEEMEIHADVDVIEDKTYLRVYEILPGHKHGKRVNFVICGVRISDSMIHSIRRRVRNLRVHDLRLDREQEGNALWAGLMPWGNPKREASIIKTRPDHDALGKPGR